MKKRLIALLFGIILVCGFVVADVYINEVELNPSGDDLGFEWVELFSNEGSIVDLDGWYILDKTATRFDFSSVSIDDFYVLDLLTGLGNGIDETLNLYNAGDVEQDATGPLNDDDNDERTWQRIPDGTGSFVFQTQTKGVSNSLVVGNININGIGDYGTIQEAINAASPGDVINVGANTYAENLLINKSLTLVGADKTTTIIDGGNSGVVVTITANDVTLSGFTITGSGSTPTVDAGVGLDIGVTGCIIEDNIVSNNAGVGIGLQEANGNTIKNNILDANNITGIGLLGSGSNTIEDNNVTGTTQFILQLGPDKYNHVGYGIWVDYGSTGNTIDGNTFSDNEIDGVYFGAGSNDNDLINNVISNNGAEGNADSHGVYFWKSGGNTVTGNTITGNYNSGIEIYQGADNVINNNDISGNGFGVNSSVAVNATFNWWGSSTGPGGSGPGTGDAVSDNVNYDPWWGCLEPADCDDGDIGTVDSCVKHVCSHELNCVDEDEDDYSITGGSCGPIDCDDDDDQIYPGATELCNGVDDDCDGTTSDGADETWLGDVCDGADSDLCEEGVFECIAGSQTCTDDTDDDIELCDGLDNDCNVATDDGVDETWYNELTACGLGVCASTGIYTCSAGSKGDTCVAGDPTGADDDCNNVDEDCSGVADDDYISDETCFLPGVCAADNVGSSCDVGVETACATGSPTGDDLDCDGVDDNCDGNNDENYVETATSCGIGACEALGLLQCIAGAETDSCVEGTPGTETCNNIDDDCDGSTDEDLNQACGSGLCLGAQTCAVGLWGDCSTKDKDCGTCALCSAEGVCDVYDETQDVDCLDTICEDSCNLIPDDNPFTWDFADDVSNECTALLTCSENSCDYSHECSISSCGAECEDGDVSACTDTECDDLDGCVGDDYHDYDDVVNTCEGDCSCSDNQCASPIISYNDSRCTECQVDANCSYLNNDYCDDTEIKHDEGRCVNYGCEVETTTIEDCNDGLACNGEETCTGAVCVAGIDVDCSGNNILAIAMCLNDPDNVDETWDFRDAFTSVCKEPGVCTSGVEAITHTCDISSCGAECEEGDTSACTDTEQCQDPYKQIRTVSGCSDLTCGCDYSVWATGFCDLGCGADCVSNENCVSYCLGEIYYYSGACEGDCTCSYLSEDCNLQDGWYDIENITQWIEDTQCTEKEQKEQEYRNYGCGGVDGCGYSVVGETQWVDTGEIRNKENGTYCDDGVFCTVDDVCTEGVCAGVQKDCSDDLFCTINERCDEGLEGECVFDSRTCADEISCTVDSCNEVIEDCEHEPDDSLCNDGISCTDNVCDRHEDCVFNPNNANCPIGQICDSVLFPGPIGCGGKINVTINAPIDDSLFGDRKVVLDISVNIEAELLEYKDLSDKNPRWRRLCRRCTEYGFSKKKTKSFGSGEHNLKIRATDWFGNSDEKEVSFFVDYKKPKISKIEPGRSGVTNGSGFYVKYTEDNLKDVSVSFNPTVVLENCNESGRNKECYVDLNLTAWDGEWVEYWFNVSDSINNVASKKVKVKVDTTSPVLDVVFPDNRISGRRVLFNMTVTEDVTLEYRDESLENPKWKRLCKNCDEYGTEKRKTKTFGRGLHELRIRATDQAGNSDEEVVEFEVDY